MIKPDQIPDEVVEAALKKRGLMREAIADAINAWPGMSIADDDDWCDIRKGWITLPADSSNG